ncbi:MAG: hydrolase 1, exosortase A system-associated [Pontixanthobacter sp.]
MSRLPLTFECDGVSLAGTLDMAASHTGLLIVSGGNEIRAGAFNGQARLARDIAQEGFPVFRFDRRGIGDSDGENRGFRHAAGDIDAAIQAFRAIAPQVRQIVAFGNCDAASALMLNADLVVDRLIASNPWTIDDDDDGPAPEEARMRYAAKLREPRELLRLITGKVNVAKLFIGLRSIAARRSSPSTLIVEMARGLEAANKPITILLAGEDRTARMFDRNWTGPAHDLARREGASHAYVEPGAYAWLLAQILHRLRA